MVYKIHGGSGNHSFSRSRIPKSSTEEFSNIFNYTKSAINIIEYKNNDTIKNERLLSKIC